MSENAAATTAQVTPTDPAAAPQSADAPTTTTTQGGDTPPAAITYEAFQLPEGMAFEAETLGKVGALFSELKLPQDQAQKVINSLVEVGPSLLKDAVSKSLLEEHEAQVKTWKDEARADPEIGGANFDTSLATAQKALGAFASPGFKALLDAMGLGNHPEVIRTFRGIGMRISEGTHVSSTGSQTPVKPTEMIYNHPTSKKVLAY